MSSSDDSTDRTNGPLTPRGCITVLVDKRGAFCGAQLPDGTEIPQILGITVTGNVRECQTAEIRLYAKIRQFTVDE